ncbi:MAG: hypothetical protein A3G34_06455 [Candidatus Lindowbacteria bacterium RIFCSPLOWO2_12_FULL_62_27]|nr:MAG: hypothetical protein A3G34_06455 [Candidatus Lindowbacteria bacterium RIFCSPLOWO2_12_FULL_62_27]OGH63728.1 MAG: hypothetical protein A3I06_01150 [Candidatus Lindowbacteria bacterium RIFCSPLOWO2_02_FULL_62_12]
MKRAAGFLALGFATGFIILTILKMRPSAVDPVPSPAWSPDRKAEVLQFWKLYDQATRFRLQGDWPGADAAYHAALGLDTGHEDSLYNLGNVLFELGRFAEAAETWRRLAEINPSSARAHAQLGALFSCGVAGAPFEPAEAEREFEKALDINKEESGAVLRIGEIALLRGNISRARRYLEAAAASNSKCGGAFYLAGYLFWLEGDAVAAAIRLKRAIQAGRESAPPAEGAGRLSLLTPYWSGISSWEETGVTKIKVDDEYRRLDWFLHSIRERQPVRVAP